MRKHITSNDDALDDVRSYAIARAKLTPLGIGNVGRAFLNTTTPQDASLYESIGEGCRRKIEHPGAE